MIKILMVDDVAILRNSIKFMLADDEELEVVGTASNGQEAFEMCSKLQPDVVLMDLKMPVCDGVEGTKLIKESFPHIKIIILTTFHEEEDIKAALGSGANGYVLKDIEPNELVRAIKNTFMGLYTIHEKAFESLKKDTGKPSVKMDAEQELYDKKTKLLLTDREKEVIRCVVSGKSYKEISKELYMTEGALRNLLSDILKKLELNDRMQLAVYAVKHNLI